MKAHEGPLSDGGAVVKHSSENETLSRRARAILLAAVALSGCVAGRGVSSSPRNQPGQPPPALSEAWISPLEARSRLLRAMSTSGPRWYENHEPIRAIRVRIEDMQVKLGGLVFSVEGAAAPVRCRFAEKGPSIDRHHFWRGLYMRCAGGTLVFVHRRAGFSDFETMAAVLDKIKAQRAAEIPSDKLDEALASARNAARQQDHARALFEYAKAWKDLKADSSGMREVRLGLLNAMRHAGFPPVSEEAKHRMARGQALFKSARNENDFMAAADEMEQAVDLAPWWAAGHFNLALAYEGSGYWKEAAEAYRSYLAFKPDAEDASAVKQKIAEMEINDERAGL